MFSTRMFRPFLLWFWTTQSMAAMACETSVWPLASATLMLTMRASGAMPTKSDEFPVTVVAAESRPAMMPAMWVPCP